MSQERNNPIKQEKIKKRQKLLDRGVNPYPHTWKKKESIKKLREQFSALSIGQSEEEFVRQSNPSAPVQGVCTVAGRLMRKRPMGKAAFFNIQDEEGELQCYIKKENLTNSSEKVNSDSSSENFSNTVSGDTQKINPPAVNHFIFSEGQKPNSWDLWKLCDIGDIVGLRGSFFKTKKGELSLKVQELKILCKSLEALPEKYHGLEDKELKYRRRYLDLIMDRQSRGVFKIRSDVIREIRSFMHEQNFMEVETPILQPIYGGAMAQPFETYFRRLNQKMYLKISPEIYLKKLIVGGFEKVFEIGKNFRNEGIDRTHNPEFTMMEYYQAYTDYKYQIKLFEKLICHVAKKIKGSLQFEYQGRELDFTSSWTKISLQEFEDVVARSVKNSSENLKCVLEGEDLDLDSFWKTVIQKLKKFKVSHPDHQSKNLKEADKNQNTKSNPSQQGIDFSLFWKKLEAGKNQTLKGLSLLEKIKIFQHYIHSINPEERVENILTPAAAPSLKEQEKLKDELVLMALELTVEKYFWDPVFIMDFPLESSPLTKKHRDKKQPRIVERFEPYIAGMELGNAYTELNDPVDQRRRLEQQRRQIAHPGLSSVAKDKKNNQDKSDFSHPVDEDFLHALEVGMPPTGGVGLGIERLVMILTDQSNIKDSMLFPILKNKLKS